MNQIQVTCDKECIYRNDGFCECDQHLLDIAEEFLRLKRGEEVEHLKERESIKAKQSTMSIRAIAPHGRG